jgi:hypothetical protein
MSRPKKTYRARIVRSESTGVEYYDLGNTYVRRSDLKPFEGATFLTGDLDFVNEIEIPRSTDTAIHKALRSLDRKFQRPTYRIR